MDEPNDALQRCLGCNRDWPAEDFVAPSGRALRTCLTCRSKITRSQRVMSRDPETAARMREQRRAFALMSFGITPEQYDGLLAHQGGVCAMCRETDRAGRRLAVDHDHTTGRVRGLLCGSCNTQLGAYEAVRDRAVAYLAEHGDGHPLLSGEGVHAPVRPGRWPGYGSSKLNEEMAEEIRRRYATGTISQRALAAEFGISQNAVGYVVRGDRWAPGGISPQTRARKAFVARRTKLSDADVKAIVARHAAGESKKSIARSLGMSHSTIIYRIRKAEEATQIC